MHVSSLPAGGGAWLFAFRKQRRTGARVASASTTSRGSTARFPGAALPGVGHARPDRKPSHAGPRTASLPLRGGLDPRGCGPPRGAPYPVFLALGGAALAFVPGAPRFTVPPEVALALFV